MAAIATLNGHKSDGSSTTSDGDFSSQYSRAGCTTTRYPIHDACELENVEFLKKTIFVQKKVRRDSSEKYSVSTKSDYDDSSSDTDDSSDDDSSGTDGANDTAAAAAAAMGHRPPFAKSPTGASAATMANASRIADEKIETKISSTNKKLPSDTYNEESNNIHQVTTPVRESTLDQSEKSTFQELGMPFSNHEMVTTPKSGTFSTASKTDITESAIDFVADITSPPPKPNDTGSIHGMDISPVQFNPQMPSTIHHDVSLVSSKSVDYIETPESNTTPSKKNLDDKTKIFSLPLSQESPDRLETETRIGNVANITEKKSNKTKRSKRKRKFVYYCPFDLNERDDDENTPLHIAIHWRRIEHMKLLLQAGASPHRKCDGSAAIHTSISIGALSLHKQFAFDAVILLQKYDADLSMRDESMSTPLYLATVYNLPDVVALILKDTAGLQTLNVRSDRVGGRALHAAAKFNKGDNADGRCRSITSQPGSNNRHNALATLRNQEGNHNSSKNESHVNIVNANTEGNGKIIVAPSGKAILTQILLSTPGIELDPLNNYGRTPLHVATSRGNWPVVRLLLQAGSNPMIRDKRGFTPGGLAYKRGIPIPNDLVPVLGAPGSGIPLITSDHSPMPPPRDLIMDPNGVTLLICHELCSKHMTCQPITRSGSANDESPPPENIRRLSVLLNNNDGILKSEEFDGCVWEGESRRAAMSDILKVHEYSYVENVSQICSQLPDHPNAIATLDADTAISRWSFEAAMRAAGSVCEAVDRIMSGESRNAFCAVRPPGHHAGPRGVVKCPNDPEGSHGFCIFNNVAIGAAYARSMYRNDGIKKIAIIDFDVHHGNGTEEIVRQLVPNIEKATVRTPFATGQFETSRYRPWLDETDMDNVFFASSHGFGPRDLRLADQLESNQGGWFYPASGKTSTSDTITSPNSVDNPTLTEFLFTQTWARMGVEALTNCCKVINVGLDLPRPGDVPGMQRVELRDSYRKNILPNLYDFDPDIIFISAGFDAHKKDTMNFGYVGMVEDDYEWLTEQLVQVANSCCNGRIVSVLEGGYKVHGGIVSPFARSVASHVRALSDGGSSRELYDKQEGEWESEFERHMVEEREHKRQLRLERLHRPLVPTEKRRIFGAPPTNNVECSNVSGNYDMDAMMKEPLGAHEGIVAGPNQEALQPDLSADDEAALRKKRRNQGIDYKELFMQMKKEGFVG